MSLMFNQIYTTVELPLKERKMKTKKKKTNKKDKTKKSYEVNKAFMK